MKKPILTLLGCSSSLTFALLTGQPTHASEVREYIFTAPSEEITDLSNCNCSDPNPLTADFTDAEGDRAITLYGCDCAGCRYRVRAALEEMNQ